MRNFLLAALAAFFIAPALAEDECKLIRHAVIPFETDDSAHVFIPTIIAGRQTRMMLDTGGFWSVIREDLAAELGLKVRTSYDIWLVDASGAKQDKYVTVPEMTLGRLSVPIPVDFVLAKMDHRPIAEFGGTIGLNFFTKMDLEIDNAKKTISLFSQKHCPGDGVHWANEAVTLKFKRDKREVIALPVVYADLDGETIRTIIDTGSTVSSVSLELAKRRFGLTPTSPGVEPSGKAHLPSGKIVDLYSYTFKALTISGIRFENVPVHIGEFDEAELILGMNELKHLHLYFAFKDKMIHVTAAEAGF
jgi:predicted aspartyl protease